MCTNVSCWHFRHRYKWKFVCFRIDKQCQFQDLESLRIIMNIAKFLHKKSFFAKKNPHKMMKDLPEQLNVTTDFRWCSTTLRSEIRWITILRSQLVKCVSDVQGLWSESIFEKRPCKALGVLCCLARVVLFRRSFVQSWREFLAELKRCLSA